MQGSRRRRWTSSCLRAPTRAASHSAAGCANARTPSRRASRKPRCSCSASSLSITAWTPAPTLESTRSTSSCSSAASASASTSRKLSSCCCAPPACRRASSPAIRAGARTRSTAPGSCARATRMPGPSTGSPGAAGCAPTRPRWSTRRGSTAAARRWRRARRGWGSPRWARATVRCGCDCATSAMRSASCGTTGCSTTDRCASNGCGAGWGWTAARRPPRPASRRPARCCWPAPCCLGAAGAAIHGARCGRGCAGCCGGSTSMRRPATHRARCCRGCTRWTRSSATS
ncbi:hypothetical protein GALL_518990 [mine drainage metagenome]|uniref:Uncharacterized protein n=1 Tax=mine drainage metagenome TaxID=410659 RepID=A0A1J5P4N9_9ZZZZ